jgi:hypothetical protein
LLDAADLIPALRLQRVNEQKTARRAFPSDEIEGAILNVITEPTHIDEISRKLGLPIEKISATLVLMELKGMVRQAGQMHYIAVRESQAFYG